MSQFGTNRTNPAGLSMSVSGARPEVHFRGRQDRSCPICDIGPPGLVAQHFPQGIRRHNTDPAVRLRNVTVLFQLAQDAPAVRWFATLDIWARSS